MDHLLRLISVVLIKEGDCAIQIDGDEVVSLPEATQLLERDVIGEGESFLARAISDVPDLGCLVTRNGEETFGVRRVGSIIDGSTVLRSQFHTIGFTGLAVIENADFVATNGDHGGTIGRETNGIDVAEDK